MRGKKTKSDTAVTEGPHKSHGLKTETGRFCRHGIKLSIRGLTSAPGCGGHVPGAVRWRLGQRVPAPVTWVPCGGAGC